MRGQRPESAGKSQGLDRMAEATEGRLPGAATEALEAAGAHDPFTSDVFVFNPAAQGADRAGQGADNRADPSAVLENLVLPEQARARDHAAFDAAEYGLGVASERASDHSPFSDAEHAFPF